MGWAVCLSATSLWIYSRATSGTVLNPCLASWSIRVVLPQQGPPRYHVPARLDPEGC